jgi:hypothetical protein
MLQRFNDIHTVGIYYESYQVQCCQVAEIPAKKLIKGRGQKLVGRICG